jgi:hypothetical protein
MKLLRGPEEDGAALMSDIQGGHFKAEAWFAARVALSFRPGAQTRADRNVARRRTWLQSALTRARKKGTREAHFA